jgi:hypothetical protein
MALQAQQIVSLACQIAKCPGYTAQAGQFLNNILQSLAQNYDFDVIRQSFNFTFNTTATGNGYVPGCGPNPMPANFLRAHKKGAFYMISGVPYTMIGYEQNEFDQFVQQAGNQAYPYAFYIDVAPMSLGLPANLYCWVPAAGAYPATVRYNPQMPDIVSPQTSATIPWFPNTDFLINATACGLMGITNDDRRQPGGAFSLPALDEQLDKYLKMKDDPESSGVKRVSLDRRLFGGSMWSRLPNTKQIGW